VVALDAEVEALYLKGGLRLDIHSSSEEGMLGVDVAAGANTSLMQVDYDCVR
jgi:hypothetical protein